MRFFQVVGKELVTLYVGTIKLNVLDLLSSAPLQKLNAVAQVIPSSPMFMLKTG